jgi:hypothetical protein
MQPQEKFKRTAWQKTFLRQTSVAKELRQIFRNNEFVNFLPKQKGFSKETRRILVWIWFLSFDIEIRE